jgi:D-alanyl-D-alanine endopeptidase (penicillin-binding protein 7)
VVQDARAARQAQQTKRATGAAARTAKAKAPEGSSAAGRAAAAAATGAVAASTAAASQPPERPSVGQTIGLNRTPDPLSLHSSVAMVTDARSGDVLLRKNTGAVLPIASITKVMTAMVVLDAQQSLDEVLSISKADIDRAKGTSSRLSPGVHLKRRELLQLALMSSENRAANALGRHYPGGLPGFVNTMNMKAKELGMGDTRFVEPTGLSSGNVSTARDLSVMVRYAGNYPLIREMSTASSLTVLAGRQQMSFFNTNRLVSSNQWSIGLQKTGYISEAGNCLVMQTLIDGRPMIVVLLDAAGKLSRFGDAQRIRDWIRKTDPPTQRLTRQSEPVRPLRVSYPLAPASS